MASSKWYYSQYSSCKRKSKDLKSKKAELEGIRNAITHDPIHGAPDGINKELNDALDEHAKGMTGDSAFNTNYACLEAKKESGVYSDSNVSGAYNAINNEINSLTGQINSAESQAKSYYSKYLQALKDEIIEKVTGG